MVVASPDDARDTEITSSPHPALQINFQRAFLFPRANYLAFHFLSGSNHAAFGADIAFHAGKSSIQLSDGNMREICPLVLQCMNKRVEVHRPRAIVATAIVSGLLAVGEELTLMEQDRATCRPGP